jgi:hypothetical protein
MMPKNSRPPPIQNYLLVALPGKEYKINDIPDGSAPEATRVRATRW